MTEVNNNNKYDDGVDDAIHDHDEPVVDDIDDDDDYDDDNSVIYFPPRSRSCDGARMAGDVAAASSSAGTVVGGGGHPDHSPPDHCASSSGQDLFQFEDACRLAIQTNRPLVLLSSSSSSSSPQMLPPPQSLPTPSCTDGDVSEDETEEENLPQLNIHIRSVIVLKQRQVLTIIGSKTGGGNDGRGGSSSRSTRSGRPTVTLSGSVHSLFLLNNSSRLVLKNINLLHHQFRHDSLDSSRPTPDPNTKRMDGDDHDRTDPNEQNHVDCRTVGAAINLRYKSSAHVENCTIQSDVGFCTWTVQKSRLHVIDSTLVAPLRSAVVAFGQCHVRLDGCQITDAGVHGVCARGSGPGAGGGGSSTAASTRCHVYIHNSRILNSTVRGLYAYGGGASVTLSACEVSGTKRSDGAAIELLQAGSTTVDVNERAGHIESSDERVKNKSNNKKKNRRRHEMTEIARTTLSMKNCRITDNAGVGVRLVGPVNVVMPVDGDDQTQKSSDGTTTEDDTVLMEHRLITEFENYFDANNGGNILWIHSQVDVERQHGNSANKNSQQQPVRRRVRRDAPTLVSSFRLGDWICMDCAPRRRRRNASDGGNSDQYDSDNADIVVVPNSKEICSECSASKKSGKSCRFLSMAQIMTLNQASDDGDDLDLTIEELLQDTDGGKDTTDLDGQREKQNIVDNIQPATIHNQNVGEESPTWWFDSDSDRGWIRYDDISTSALEKAYQMTIGNSDHHHQIKTPITSDRKHLKKEEQDDDDDDDDDLDGEINRCDTGNHIVLLSRGKYRVDLRTMEQINTQTHFPRLVRRVPPTID